MKHTIEFKVNNYDELKQKATSFENDGYVFVSAYATTTTYYAEDICVTKVTSITVKMEKEEKAGI